LTEPLLFFDDELFDPLLALLFELESADPFEAAEELDVDLLLELVSTAETPTTAASPSDATIDEPTSVRRNLPARRTARSRRIVRPILSCRSFMPRNLIPFGVISSVPNDSVSFLCAGTVLPDRFPVRFL
jgi:hypothetical protein